MSEAPHARARAAASLVDFRCDRSADELAATIGLALTQREREEASVALPRLDRFAGRLAAKRAAGAAASGSSHRGGGDIEVISRGGQPPVVVDQEGLFVSIAHDGGLAIAIALFEPRAAD